MVRLFLALALRAILYRGSGYFEVLSSFTLACLGIFPFWLRWHIYFIPFRSFANFFIIG